MAHRFDKSSEKPAKLQLASKRKVMQEFSNIRSNLLGVKPDFLAKTSED